MLNRRAFMLHPSDFIRALLAGCDGVMYHRFYTPHAVTEEAP
jgi:hypothetical protein